MRATALALGLFLTSSAVSLVPYGICNFGFITPAAAQPAAITTSQSDALNAYNTALNRFKSILSERRAQINSHQPLPNLPGQALYLARVGMMSAYKDLTDALPSKIGRPNKFGIPPAYFDADDEPLLDEYRNLFDLMDAPPFNAQNSDTPFKDVVDLATDIARAKGLDPANAEVAGRIGLGIFFAETNGNQNIGNARSNTYKGSLQTGPSEDRNGQRKWAEIKGSIAAFDPALIARDAKEEARAGAFRSPVQSLDRRARRPHERACGHFSENTGDREGIAGPDRSDEVFRAHPNHSRARPRPRSIREAWPAIEFPIRRSWAICATTASSPSAAPTGPRTSATFREILDAMWLFNDKFEHALAKFAEIKARRKRAP